MPRREASREAVAATLWPNQDNDAARHCLASALWRIKALFGDAVNPIIVRQQDLVLRMHRSLWIDAVALERRARPLVDQPNAACAPSLRHRLRRALLSYGGDFLPAIDAEWALLERERLRCLRLDALYALAALFARDDDWTGVVATTRLLCAAEPLREDAQRLLMLGYAKAGNRALALRQFRSCVAILESELGVAPMDETLQLYRSLSGASPRRQAPARPQGLRSALIATRDSMHVTLGLIENTLAAPPTPLE
jgi:DNA-binding SARP family transcriptional activator